MADTATSSRVEPSIGPAPVSSTAGPELRAAVESAAAPADHGGAMTPSARPALDQLSRIEDKTARIEEKFARAEALMQRVGSTMEEASGRMHEVASRAELAMVRNEVTAMAAQVRRLPGKTAMVAVAIVTSLLTAAIVLVLLRYGLPR